MDKNFILKIYCLNQPLLHTEWLSLLGDKYCHSLPFAFTLTEKIDEAHVVAWDGVVSPKMRSFLPELNAHLKKGKVLLLMGEGTTLYNNHPIVEMYRSDEVATIMLPGWSVLPEELLGALENCYQKIKNV